MSLHDELAAYKSESRAKASPATVATMQGGVADVRSTGIEAAALGVGAMAPDFTLPDVDGAGVRLFDLLGHGPVVVVFYRGAWCPYCNLQLRAYQQLLPQLKASGASLVAISPQLPDGSLSTKQKGSLEFPVLSDVELVVAKAFGVAYDVPPAVQTMSLGFGNDLAVKNGVGGWMLPIPATYVIARDARIALAHVDADYTVRLEPDAVLATLAQLSAGH
ncbi:MAG: peroxiredoxin-like family protein [Casimicrobiaceae bacterium]